MEAKWKMAPLAGKQLNIKEALLHFSIVEGNRWIKSENLADCKFRDMSELVAQLEGTDLLFPTGQTNMLEEQREEEQLGNK